ncbi:MAG: adenine phosphoribosyltransferase [Phycisphaerae bacterium SM23_30]|nr:MAG: adenine phosphoribosyltransferase [Phycisphaerae bacterium SM23_30]
MSEKLRRLIRNVPDFPKPGIVFRDITPLLAHAEGLALAARKMADPFRRQMVDLVVGAESRGFIFGALAARELHCGFVPVRKPGKLPAQTVTEKYQLEYGADQLQMHADALKPGQKVLLVDDLLATGGTMQACCRLVEKLGGHIVGISFLIELAFLHGRDKLIEYPVRALISYDTE